VFISQATESDVCNIRYSKNSTHLEHLKQEYPYNLRAYTHTRIKGVYRSRNKDKGCLLLKQKKNKDKGCLLLKQKKNNVCDFHYSMGKLTFQLPNTRLL